MGMQRPRGFTTLRSVNTVYGSLIDRWLLVVFATTSVIVLLAFVSMFVAGFSAASLVLVPVLLAAVALPWWIVATTDYTLTNHSIEVRSGPFHWTVPYRDITRIEATRSPLSSPALSLDRLRIQYSAGAQIMISPERRAQFLNDLRTRGVTVAMR
jgi:membrane protein YdbS with pleckstrin-like domain